MVDAFARLVPLVLLSLFAAQLRAQELAADRFRIDLSSGSFVPQRRFALALPEGRKTNERLHVLLQFDEVPDRSVRIALEAAGVHLLGHVPRNAWFASVPAGLDLKSPALSSLRWMGKILPQDKIAPTLWNWFDADAERHIFLKYFADADVKSLRARIRRRGARILGEDAATRSIALAVHRDAMGALAEEDSVRWIEPVAPPARGESWRIRAHVQADTVQGGYGLAGQGVIVGILENAHADMSHPDLSGRLSRGDADPASYDWHPTNVAGVIGGDGFLDFNLRGMAPAVDLLTYNMSSGGTTAEDYLNYSGDLQAAVRAGVDVANNSWGSLNGCHDVPYGLYTGLSLTLDAVVRGDFGRPMTVVFSAGNERAGYLMGDQTQLDCVDRDMAPWANYGTMNHPKAAKNTIVVGAVDSANSRMTAYSSWGPLNDGRIKPEVVASGHHLGTGDQGVSIADDTSQMYLAPYSPTWVADYGFFGLTSCAAAATSGCIALLLEDFRQEPKIQHPLPSTIKALLVHSAADLADATSWYNPGPDYASGFGLVQIGDAISLRRSGSFAEGTLDHDQQKLFLVTVPSGVPTVKVTLAWDDVPAVENAAGALVNDLDLYVVDGDGVHHHPWVLDPDNPAAPAFRSSGVLNEGVDHVNNIEQVVVDSVGAGPAIWRAYVKGHYVPEGPQRFSIVAHEVEEYELIDWSNRRLEPEGGGYTSLALDSEDRPHIAHAVGYPQNPSYAMRYLWRSGAVWHREVLTSGRPVAFLSLALDAEGNPHLAYQENFSITTLAENILTYRHKSGGTWRIEQLSPPSQNPVRPSLAISANGEPHIAYPFLDGTSAENTLKYLYKRDGTWRTEEPDPSVTATHVSLAFDFRGRPHVAYTVRGPAGDVYLKHAHREAGTSLWTTETIDDRTGLRASMISLALSSTGDPHVSYWDYSIGTLRYAWRDGNGAWRTELLTSGVMTGGWSSLAIDSRGRAHVAYQSQRTLKYARRLAGWMEETADADSPRNVGLHVSLALDSGDAPHMAYQSGVEHALRYASASSSSDCSLVDNGDGTVSEVCRGLMWLQDASLAHSSGHDMDGRMDWYDSMAWAGDLSFAGYSDWRLPTTRVPDPSCGDFGPDYVEGYCSGSEMGHLYYAALENMPGANGFTNSGPFLNIGEDGDPSPNYAFYWSATELDADRAHHFLFNDGYTNPSGTSKSDQQYFAWAVRDILPSDTPTGQDATVTPGSGVSVTFATVASGGATTVTESPDNPGSSGTGFGFEFFGNFYSIQTTADYDDAAGAENVTVCLSYDVSELPIGTAEADVVVKRWNGTSWEDPITSTVDVGNNIACGTFPGLSWFGVAAQWDVSVPAEFRRGDCNDDGFVDISDAVFQLEYSFLGGPPPPCRAACDANADGDMGGTADPIYTLTYRFVGGPPPPDPFPECGRETLPLGKALGCETSPVNCP